MVQNPADIKITNKFEIVAGIGAMVIYLKGYSNLLDIYNKLKFMWRKTKWMKYDFPLVAIHPKFFEVKRDWAIANKYLIQDAGFAYLNDAGKVVENYVLLKGLGPFRDKVEISRDGEHSWIKCVNPWNEGNIIVFESGSKGLWIKHNDKIVDLNKMSGMEIQKIKGVAVAPWPFLYNNDFELQVESFLPNQLFEI